MNKADLVAAIAAKAEISKVNAQAALDATVETIIEALKKGDQAILDLDGIGQSRLIEIKKAMRAKGIEVPGSEE